MAGATSTDLIPTETETRTAPQATSQNSEGIDSDLPEQEIDVVGLKTDKETVHNIITKYVERLDTKTESQLQTNPSLYAPTNEEYLSTITR